MYVYIFHNGLHRALTGDAARVTIDMLPDLALLEIFDHCVDDDLVDHDWHPLVHVCQRWRNIVFASPRRLNLRLLCTARTSVQEMLDIWPPLPIVVWCGDSHVEAWDADYMIEVLEHRDRIYALVLFDVPRSQLETVLALLQQPFPALRHLLFRHIEEMPTTPVVITASFLGGSAPLLQTLDFDFFPFPELPNLLLSATQLVYLSLRNISHPEHLSPEAIVTCLSVMTKLEDLTITIEFQDEFRQHSPGQEGRLLPPETRTLLPALTSLAFCGFEEYLEDLVARIDTPLLNELGISFFYQQIHPTPRLSQFISRTPTIRSHGEARAARVFFSACAVSITLSSTSFKGLTLSILFNESEEPLSLPSVVQAWSLSFLQTFILAVEDLYILEDDDDSILLGWENDIENSQWLELLHLFIALKDLYLSSRIMPRIVPALQELVEERETEVLPALQTLFLEKTFSSEHVQQCIGQFVAARQVSGHPITVSRWKKDFNDVIPTFVNK